MNNPAFEMKRSTGLRRPLIPDEDNGLSIYIASTFSKNMVENLTRPLLCFVSACWNRIVDTYIGILSCCGAQTEEFFTGLASSFDITKSSIPVRTTVIDRFVSGEVRAAVDLDARVKRRDSTCTSDHGKVQ